MCRRAITSSWEHAPPRLGGRGAGPPGRHRDRAAQGDCPSVTGMARWDRLGRRAGRTSSRRMRSAKPAWLRSTMGPRGRRGALLRSKATLSSGIADVKGREVRKPEQGGAASRQRSVARGLNCHGGVRTIPQAKTIPTLAIASPAVSLLADDGSCSHSRGSRIPWPPCPTRSQRKAGATKRTSVMASSKASTATRARGRKAAPRRRPRSSAAAPPAPTVSRRPGGPPSRGR